MSNSRPQQQQSVVSPLDTLKASLDTPLQQVNKRILETAQSVVRLIPDIAKHTINSGGKRLRPLLTLACAELCQYKGTAHIDLAAAVEFIHTSTLLHDDVVDNSLLRRGLKTANNIWGNKETILVGDFLFAKSFELMASANSLAIYQTLSSASVIIAEGEVLQLTPPDNIAEAEPYYNQVITAKTAELFAAACRVSAMLANKDDKTIQALHQYGISLGIAFQIVDDLLDYSTNQEQLGKQIGDDFNEGKITLPIIKAYQVSSDEEKQCLQRCFIEGDRKSGDLECVIQLLHKYDIMEQTMASARIHVNQAKEALSLFGDQPFKTILCDITDFTISRRY